MKFKNLFGVALMLGTLSVATVSSCTDDEQVPVAMNYTGTYKTSNTILVAGQSLGTLPQQSVTLVKEAGGTYIMTISAYELEIANEGTPITHVQSDPMIIKGVQLTKDKDGITQIYGKIDTTVKMLLKANYGKSAKAKEYVVKEGTVVGKLNERGQVEALVTFKPGSMPMPLIYQLAPAE